MNIYKFTHIETGRVYVGQTTQDPNRRRLEHLSDSRYTKRTHRFHNALRKYGEDAFKFDVIASASKLEELNLLETKYIKEYNSIENGFNIRNGGDNKTHNQESIEKMRVAQKTAHARRREAGSDTWIRKDGGAMLGKSHSKETKNKMSLSQIGKSHSTETKLKMSTDRKGRVVSDATKQKMRGRPAWNKGLTGVLKVSDVTKQKLREKSLQYWANKKANRGEN